MKRLLLILVVVTLASCSPQRRLARLIERYPIPADTVVEIHTEYQSDTIEVQLPGDTVEVQVELEVPIDLPDTTIYAETDFALASAGLLLNALWLNLIHKDVIVPVEVDSVIVTVYEDRIITKTVTVDESKPFYKSGFFILAGLFIIALLFYFLLRR